MLAMTNPAVSATGTPPVSPMKRATSSSSGAPSRKVPSTYKVTGSVKEQHGCSIYCAAWSTDEYEDDGVPMEGQDPISAADDVSDDERDVGVSVTNKKDYGASDTGVGTTAASSSAGAASEVSSNGPSQPPSRPTGKTLLCFATCGGNRVSLYEVEKSSGDKNRRRKGNITLRQGYLDADEDEVFYSCVFGGRTPGGPLGYGPIWKRTVAPDGSVVLDTSMINDTRSNGDESSRKRPREETENKANDRVGEKGSTDDIGFRNGTFFPDLLDTQKFDGPQLLCVAGTRGVIKVIDPVRRMLFTTLSGHGDDIYDLKFSPANEWLILSASKDESLRLWNVKTSTCVAIFAGHEGHRDCVLSVGWHPLGQKFASGGMDTTVKLWNLENNPDVQNAIAQSSHQRTTRTWDGRVDPTAVPQKQRFSTVYEQMPYFSTHKVHTNYVDCVQFVGDLVLSKDTNNTIVLWIPDTKQANRNTSTKAQQHRLPSEVIAVREFNINKCDVWFMRFHTDWDCTLLALGNTIGEIRVWEIGPNPTKKHFCTLIQQYCASAVRMTAFSPDSRLMVASCDDSSVWVWEAV